MKTSDGADNDESAYSRASVERSYAPFIVAISGKSGCGNSTVSRLLSDSLGFALVNYTFRNMADETGTTLDALLEKAARDSSLDRELDARQVALAKKGDSVVGSRLAIWMIPDAALKVYLRASDFVRSKRIHAREGGDFESTIEATRYRDAVDRARYSTTYGIDIEDLSVADLVIDTERFDARAVADIVYGAVVCLRGGIR